MFLSCFTLKYEILSLTECMGSVYPHQFYSFLIWIQSDLFSFEFSLKELKIFRFKSRIKICLQRIFLNFSPTLISNILILLERLAVTTWGRFPFRLLTFFTFFKDLDFALLFFGLWGKYLGEDLRRPSIFVFSL